MSEYIRRDVVMDALLNEQYGYLCEDAIRAIPNADVREVVLCRDCRYFEPFRTHDGFCKISGMLENNDFFCAYGDCPNCGADMRDASDETVST